MLRNTLAGLACLILSAAPLAHQAGTEPVDSPLQPIYHLFDAMREHNGKKLLQQFSPQAVLQRALNNGEVKTTDIHVFANSISKPERYLDEQLLSVTLQQQNNLASVWTPFAFYLDGKLSHCGSNSFQLIKIAEQWKIHYLIDVTHPGDCEQFINQHKHQ